jgi:predicted AAA+ superfamily ATPase
MDDRALALLTRLTEALERLAPAAAAPVDLYVADAFVWQPSPARLVPVEHVSRVAIALLKGVEQQKAILLENTLRFVAGLPANNAMLWGARGNGKSSLVKAVHAEANARRQGSLVLIEIHREDIRSLPTLLNLLRGRTRRCLIMCDDLSFEKEDSDYKALKSVLDGGIEGRPDNVLFYATSNRRHLMPRDMIDNERSTAINPSEAVEEKVSLSDRFGIWLGFHNCDQATYFAMVEGYAESMNLAISVDDLRAKAVEWSVTRGARSGRVAWQCIQDLAGQLGMQRTGT